MTTSQRTRISLMGFALTLVPILADSFPEAEISNGQLRVKLYLPDSKSGYYRATRFDWSGVIASLEYKGHSYFGQWFQKYDAKIHDSITGPVEEFLTGNVALGYDEAKPGGTFVRIGVGVLRKPDEPQFRRFFTYDIVDPGEWTVRRASNSVEFTHAVADAGSGYGYRYLKTVRLVRDKPEMTLEHTLKNTGSKTIRTDVYNHNFFVIDGQPTGPDFSVQFPFPLKATRDLRGLAEIRGSTLGYLKEFGPTDRVQTELTGFTTSDKDHDIRIENRKSRAGVRLRGDRPLSRVIFWSAEKVLSPENYVTMEIEPGREFRWKIVYEFYTL